MSRNHQRIGWAAQTRSERAKLAAQLPMPCGQCGQMVTREMRWVVGHVDPLSVVGRDTGLRQPEHDLCSKRSGGRLAHQRRANGAVQDIRPW